MSGLAWGFKSDANRIARELREELGLQSASPLDPWALAEHLGIPVVPLSEFRAAAPKAVERLMRGARSVFSAVTVFDGLKRLIVVNDSHSRERQASSLAHELAHSLLMHEQTAAFDEPGVRRWDATQEAEADWLAGALLVSDEAAVAIARQGLRVWEAARLYGVSVEMMRFRLNVSGAKKRVERAARWNRPRSS